MEQRTDCRERRCLNRNRMTRATSSLTRGATVPAERIDAWPFSGPSGVLSRSLLLPRRRGEVRRKAVRLGTPPHGLGLVAARLRPAE